MKRIKYLLLIIFLILPPSIYYYNYNKFSKENQTPIIMLDINKDSEIIYCRCVKQDYLYYCNINNCLKVKEEEKSKKIPMEF